MPDVTVFALATCVGALMLIVAVRGLTWHKVSPFLTSLLLLLVLFATWQVVGRSGSLSLEQWVLFTLSALVGLIVGLIHGQNTAMNFVPSEGDVLCRRGGLLIFCWAVAVVVSISLLTMPGLRASFWKAALPPALVFLTAAFTTSTLTIIARTTSLRREHLSRPEHERLAQ